MEMKQFIEIIQYIQVPFSKKKYMLRNINTNQAEISESRLGIINVQIKNLQSVYERILEFQKQIISNLDLLYSMRIIQKLARPLPREDKKRMVNQFARVVKIVHSKMNVMEEQINLGLLYYEKQHIQYLKNKKKIEQVINGKLSFFNIRKKYLQVLTTSSFIHYKKIGQVFDINQKIDLIDPDKWLSNCVQKMQKNNEKNSRNSCC